MNKSPKDELEIRADEVGKSLRNTYSSKLVGCKEIKLRDSGIRIVFRVTNEIVDILRIVYVLTIEHRSDDYVFKIAAKRLGPLKTVQKTELFKVLQKATKWKRKK
jgi:mRNA interferase RelE/StbE